MKDVQNIVKLTTEFVNPMNGVCQTNTDVMIDTQINIENVLSMFSSVKFENLPENQIVEVWNGYTHERLTVKELIEQLNDKSESENTLKYIRKTYNVSIPF
jgi:hypothetical protein